MSGLDDLRDSLQTDHEPERRQAQEDGYIRFLWRLAIAIVLILGLAGLVTLLGLIQ